MTETRCPDGWTKPKPERLAEACQALAKFDCNRDDPSFFLEGLLSILFEDRLVTDGVDHWR
jgi:hypothetical protein